MKAWILSAAWVILAVLGIRWAVKDRVSLRLRYSLWLLVLARLLIPVNFFESPFSIQMVLPEPPVSEIAEYSEPIQGPKGDQTTVISDETQPRLSAGEVLKAVWVTGAVLLGTALLGSNLHFSARLRRDRQRIGECISPVPVYVSAKIDTPCLVGLFRPVIYVTPETATGSAFDHVLAHELTHLRHFDHVLSLLRCVALALHWYNPLVWIAVKLSMEDGELACDEGALTLLGDEARMGYGETLIQLTCTAKKKGFPVLTATTMTSSKRSIRNRIRSIAAGQNTAHRAVALVILLTIFTVGCAFTDAPETTVVYENAGTTSAALDDSPTPYASRYYTQTADEAELELLSILPMWQEETEPGSTQTGGDGQETVYLPLYHDAIKHKLDYKLAHNAEEVKIIDVVKLVDTAPEREESLEIYRIAYDITTDSGHETEYYYFEWYGCRDEDGFGGYSWSDFPCYEMVDFRMPDGSMP